MSDAPTRWWFVGVSGSGKTTYARAVAATLGVQHQELDALFHQENWTPLDPAQFRQKTREFAAGTSWTVDGNYRVVRDLLWERAEVIVAFDLPRRTVMRQIVARTWRRGWRRQELWNGNRESLRNFLRWNPEKSIIRWSWTTYSKMRERTKWFEALAADRGIIFVKVTSHTDAARQLAEHLGVTPEVFLG